MLLSSQKVLSSLAEFDTFEVKKMQKSKDVANDKWLLCFGLENRKWYIQSPKTHKQLLQAMRWCSQRDETDSLSKKNKLQLPSSSKSIGT